MTSVVVPAGRRIGEAAAWVGRACWVELRLHQVLTAWLAVEADHAQRVAWWSLRSTRAELAEAWHHRLPELRELPRPALVVSPGPEVSAHLDHLAGLDDPDATEDRVRALAGVLAALGRGYRRHAEVAVGPADAPVAASLVLARARTDADLRAMGPGHGEADLAVL